MVIAKVFLLVAFSGCVLTEEASLFKPCDVHDMECLSESAEKFLEQTSQGIAQYDVKPLDPLLIPSLDFVLDEERGIIMHFKNVNIVGFKKQKISNFVMNLDKKSVILTTKVNLNITGELTVDTKDKSKAFEALYSAETSTAGTSRYNYEIKTDDKGVEYFDVGPESISCEISGEPVVTLSPEFQISTGENKEKHNLNLAYRNKTLCKLIEVGYSVAIHNLRAAAKILPKSAFFIGL